FYIARPAAGNERLIIEFGVRRRSICHADPVAIMSWSLISSALDNRFTVRLHCPGKIIVRLVVVVPPRAPWVARRRVNDCFAQGIFEMPIHEHEIATPDVPVRWPLVLLCWIEAAIERTVGLGVAEHDHLCRIGDVVLSHEPLEKWASNIA